MTPPRARRSASPTVSTARKGCKKASQRSSASLGGAGSTTAPACDDEDGRAQVAKDAREVAVSLLANKRRREVSGQVMAKVTATTLFLDTVSFKTELIKQHAFLNRVRKLLKDKDVKRDARALVTEECASTSDQSENTVHVTADVARTRREERSRNPHPFYVEVVHALSRGDISATQAVHELQQVGVRVTKAFLKRVCTAQSFRDDIPHYSECEDGRGRPSALSNAYLDQLAKIVKHYIRVGISLSQETILSMAKNFYRDEHHADPSDKTFGSAWFYRFLNRHGIDTSLYNPQDALRLNAATEHNVSNYYQRVAQTAFSNGFATWNADFDANDRSSEMIIWNEEKKSRVFTFDEAKVMLAYEKGVRGVRMLVIKGEDNRRSAVTANDAFAASVMGCRNLAGESLAPYFVCTTQPNVEDGFEIPGTITDTTTGACQQAQWIRGTKKGSFDGFAFATWLKDHLAPCVPDLSPENPAMVICDGCYAHTVDEVLEICAAMGILMVILPPHCTHILQGEDLYHFGVFKGAFRVERAEIEAMKQLAAAWFIKLFENGVATSFGQREFWYAVKEAWKGAWTKQAVEKGFKMQGLVPFNRAPLWKNFPNHERKEPQRSTPDKESQVEAAERCVERMSIPGAPGLRVIAQSSDSTFDVTFDGSPESFARAPLNMMKLDEVYKSLVENPSNHSMNDEHLNVMKQLILEKQENITKNIVTTTRKQRSTRRHDRYDEATAPAMARLLAARQKREKTKKRTHDAAQDGCDARFKDNTDDIQFLAALHKRLDDNGSLEKSLTRAELMKVMRAKRIPLPQGPTADILRDKLKEVDERLYEANIECTRVANARWPKRARHASSVDDANVRCEVKYHPSGVRVQLITD